MKIALIGPGIMPIPPQGWGAVEIIVWHVYQQMTKFGHEVVIFNDKNLKTVCDSINSGGFDFVHSHYDEHVPFLNSHLKMPFVCTSHYGWLLKFNRWDHNYYDRLFSSALEAPGIFALSSNIAEMFKKAGAKGFVTFLRNGTYVDDMKFKKDGQNNRALYLGQVSHRKQQGLISKFCGHRCAIDFVGPKADNSLKDNGKCQYTGAWTKECVNNYMTNYNCLVLISDGEAAPLVVIEALAAGLSIVVSRAASENLEPKPFISIVEDNQVKINAELVSDEINKQIENNKIYREEIREYARQRFDWSVICREYEKKIGDFNDSLRNSGR